MCVRSSKRVLLPSPPLPPPPPTHDRLHSTHHCAALPLPPLFSARASCARPPARPPSFITRRGPRGRQRVQGRASPRLASSSRSARRPLLDRSDSPIPARGAAQPSADKLRFLGFLVDPVVGADKPREAR
ncbi:hypothetical protein PVAP13_5NG170969 [Panicum virgatum]|uniref:Uncharacterized protein n=1 Tax=Panicum virgatum TaxID=38727 RepID=A0A8T0S9E9_PANVG|nr:hypothetical protein PVAP13_5NG170969 [Panicum virgatum]